MKDKAKVLPPLDGVEIEKYRNLRVVFLRTEFRVWHPQEPGAVLMSSSLPALKKKIDAAFDAGARATFTPIHVLRYTPAQRYNSRSREKGKLHELELVAVRTERATRFHNERNLYQVGSVIPDEKGYRAVEISEGRHIYPLSARPALEAYIEAEFEAYQRRIADEEKIEAMQQAITVWKP